MPPRHQAYHEYNLPHIFYLFVCQSSTISVLRFVTRALLLKLRSILIATSLRYSILMDLKTLFKLLQKLSWKNGRKHQSSTHRARPQTILEMLTPDLIIYIAQFLPLSSTALFALSCHTARATLGTHYWTRLREEDQCQQQIDFLSQLSKDLSPDYVPCHHCRVLHLCTIRYSHHLPTRPFYQYDKTPCYKAEVLGKVSKFIHGDFQFRTFQMAMKKDRQGLRHQVWLECLCRQSIICRIMQRFPSEVKSTAKIVDSSLLFRTQCVILISPRLTIRNLDRWAFNICPHIRVVTHGTEANLPETAGCTMNHQHARRWCVRKSKTLSCTACPTEYDLRLEECGKFDNVAIFTKWMDLGEGKTIMDPKWFSHLSNDYTASSIFRGIDDINGRRLIDRDPVRSNFVSIRDSFEQDKSSRIDPILPLEIAQRLYQMPY